MRNPCVQSISKYFNPKNPVRHGIRVTEYGSPVSPNITWYHPASPETYAIPGHLRIFPPLPHKWQVRPASVLAGHRSRLARDALHVRDRGAFLLADDGRQAGDGRMFEHFAQGNIHAELFIDPGKCAGGG